MPGHQKKAKPGEVDPDPTPYLVVTLEMKREFQQKPYDAKKSYWCPDGKGGYAECMLEEDDGTKAKVVVNGFEVIYRLKFQSSNNAGPKWALFLLNKLERYLLMSSILLSKNEAH